MLLCQPICIGILHGQEIFTLNELVMQTNVLFVHEICNYTDGVHQNNFTRDNYLIKCLGVNFPVFCI